MARCSSLKLADNTGDFGLARCAGLIVAEYTGDLGLAHCTGLILADSTVQVTYRFSPLCSFFLLTLPSLAKFNQGNFCCDDLML